MSDADQARPGSPGAGGGSDDGTDPVQAHRALQERVLEAALPHVPFDGWTLTALRAAGRDLDMAGDAVLRTFPGGAMEMLDLYTLQADRRMVEALEEADLGAMKIREKIAFAVRTRLEQNAAHREAIRRGLSVLALPQNAPLAARSLYRTVDAIWYGIGDRSVDFSFYTKRALLSAVYMSTLLCWLDDSSEGSAETWRFLDRRVADVMRIPKFRQRVRSAVSGMPDPRRALRALRSARRRLDPVSPRR